MLTVLFPGFSRTATLTRHTPSVPVGANSLTTA